MQLSFIERGLDLHHVAGSNRIRSDGEGDFESVDVFNTLVAEAEGIRSDHDVVDRHHHIVAAFEVSIVAFVVEVECSAIDSNTVLVPLVGVVFDIVASVLTVRIVVEHKNLAVVSNDLRHRLGVGDDGEGEGHNRVATVNIGASPGVSTGSGVGGTVPIEGGNSLSRFSASVAVVDGEVESNHRVTTVDGVESNGVVARSGVGRTVSTPSVAVASGGVDIVDNRVVDGEDKRDNAVATIGSGGRVGHRTVVDVGAVGNAVDPSVAIASRLDIGASGRIEDSQMESDNGVAALSIDERVGRSVGGSSVSDTVHPSEVVAAGDGLSTGGAVVNRQMESNDTVAASSIGGGVGGVVGRSRVVDTMPSVAVASGSQNGACSAVVNGEVQGNSAIATMSIGGMVGSIVGRSRVGSTVPCVAIASGSGNSGLSTIVDGQVQRSERVPMRDR